MSLFFFFFRLPPDFSLFFFFNAYYFLPFFGIYLEEPILLINFQLSLWSEMSKPLRWKVGLNTLFWIVFVTPRAVKIHYLLLYAIHFCMTFADFMFFWDPVQLQHHGSPALWRLSTICRWWRQVALRFDLPTDKNNEENERKGSWFHSNSIISVHSSFPRCISPFLPKW